MSQARLTLVLALAPVLLFTSACSEQNSTISLSYDLDGTEKTVVMHPSSVTCGPRTVAGTSVKSDPIGSYGFSLGKGELLGPGEASFSQNEETTVFQAKEISVITKEGKVSVPETTGTVKVGKTMKPGDKTPEYRETTGTITANLTCDPKD